MTRTKVLVDIQRRRGEPRLPVDELARFVLEDDQIAATYPDEARRKWIEGGVVRTEVRGTLTPDDGRRFFEALDDVFRESSTVEVFQLANPTEPIDVAKREHRMFRTRGEGADKAARDAVLAEPKVYCDWDKETLVPRDGVLVAVPKEEAPPPPAWLADILAEHG